MCTINEIEYRSLLAPYPNTGLVAKMITCEAKNGVIPDRAYSGMDKPDDRLLHCNKVIEAEGERVVSYTTNRLIMSG